MIVTVPLSLIAAVVALVAFAGLVAFQVALAAGAPWGRAAYGGQTPGVLPARLRISSVVGAVVWTGVALAVARYGGIPVWAPLPDAWLPVAIWVIVGLLAIGVALNTITRSAVERAIWLPVTLVLLAATLVVALTASV
ncbi:hypothetical protein [Pseudolysinimonas sp.]|uniref:hypothetical protein n=1 Tax=Pseudolysinimonas sp. TaxID=2680009 RepID=UPI00286D0CCA|nr:hypothetical protein [Pseudolysinimonas sp.]